MKWLLVTAAYLGATGCAAGTGAAGGSSETPRPSSNDRSSDGSIGGRGPAITYRPVSNAAYTLYRLDSLTLHLPGNALQQQSLERTAYLRLTLTEGVGGYRATIVLDSLQAKASAIAMPPDSLTPVRGTRWTAVVTPSGEIRDLTADRSTTFGDQLTNHLRLLFPTLPAGGAKIGSTWADSTRFPLRADAFDATEQATTGYRALDDNKGLKIESDGTYKRSGKGMRFQQELEMTASGKRRGRYNLGRDGVLVSAEGSESGDMTITIPSTGQTVPVDQSGHYRIRAIGR